MWPNMAPGSDASYSDLSKMRKNELIDIILNNKIVTNISDNLITGESDSKTGVNCVNSAEIIENDDPYVDKSSDGDCCDRTSCQKYVLKYEFLRRENGILYDTIDQMKKRLENQEELINLMKICGSSPATSSCDAVKPSLSVKDTFSAVVKKPKIKEVNDPACTVNNNKSDTAGLTKKQPTIRRIETNEITSKNEIDSKRKYVNKQGNRTKPIIGSNDTASSVTAIARKGYLHVYRLKPETTDSELEAYLKVTAPTIKFQCEVLKRTEVSCSFRITFPIEHLDEVYKPVIWPKGAAIKRYFFPRIGKDGRTNANFQETALQETTR